MESRVRVFPSHHILHLTLLGVLLHPRVHAMAWFNRAWYAVYLAAVSFLLSFLLVPFVLRLGDRFHLVDHPDPRRKHHGAATALTGGIAVYMAVATTIILNFQFSVQMKAILVAATAIFVVGVLDDAFGLSARIRLAVQVAAAVILIAFGVHITFVPEWLGGFYTESLITLVWLVGITNSMNFIDGMDGLAAGTSIICALFFAVVSLITQQHYMTFLAVAAAGSCLGFFLYNFRVHKPALIFLGDGGSTFLGFLLASFAIYGEWGESSVLDLFIPVLIMSVLIFDMTLTTVVRIHSGEVRSFGQWIHYTGRDHFHHRLTDLGFGKVRSTVMFFLVSVCFGLEALVMMFSSVWVSVVILIHSALVFVLIGLILVAKGNGCSRVPGEGKQR